MYEYVCAYIYMVQRTTVTMCEYDKINKKTHCKISLFKMCVYNIYIYIIYYYTMTIIYVYIYDLLQIMEMNNMAGYPVPHHHRERDRDERRYSVPHGPNAPLPPAASEDLHAWSIYR